MPGIRARTSASHACASMSFIFAVTIREYMNPARSPPRGDPAKSHVFRPRAAPRRARSTALFVMQMRPSSVNRDGRHEVLGMEIGTSEAEPIWTEFLRTLTRR